MANTEELFHGAGGGGSNAPTNTPDSLFSEDIVEIALAISEGPIRGLSQGAKSFYVGDTPLMAQDGTLNFEKFAIGVHPGYPDGIAKPLDLVMDGESSNTNVGVNLLSGVAVTRQTDAILRNQIDTLEVRLNFARLAKTDDAGTWRNTANFKIEYKPASGGAWASFYPEAIISLEGKTTTGAVKEFSVSVPRINDDYQIRVTKVSPDSNTTTFVDISWDSFQMITKGPKTYNDTAVLHLIGVSTGQFSSIPDMLGIYDGLLVRVPSNYNPDLKTYDDTVPWNGSFKFAWTDNPAWVLYDMIVNQRYGLAAHRVHIDANRFDFYLAARWCDERVLVNNGPETRARYTFNDVIVEPRPAMEMLNYVAGSFNAIVWDDLQGQIHLKVDRDEPAVAVFSPESVTEEGFEYTFTDLTTRANDISVAFVNPDLDWNEDRRRIPNVTTSEDAIAKFGRVPMDFIAVGCTNAHEAVTKAQVRLISALTETTMVTFVTTRQGMMLSMLDIVLVADPVMGWSQTGRITSYDSQYINFRDPIYIEEMKQYKVKLQTVTGIVEVDVTPEQIGHVNRLALNSVVPEDLPRYTTFALEDTSGFGFAKPFRITAIEEVDGSPYQFRISAVEVNRNKYVQAETNTNLDEIQYSYKTPPLPGIPTNFHAESGDKQVFSDPQTGLTVSRILCSWNRPFATVVQGYELQYQRVGQDYDWQSLTGITAESVYISPAEPDAEYSLRVCAVAPNGRKSAWAVIASFTASGPQTKPKTVAAFTARGDLFQNILEWTFEDVRNIRKVEVYGSTVDDVTGAPKLADLSYPTSTWTHLGLSFGVTIFYWLRVQNTSGVYSDFTTPSRSATTITDPKKILDILNGKLTSDQLYIDLRSRIDKIDAPEVGLIDGLQKEIQDRADALSAEAAARVAGLLAEAAARGAAITTVNQTIQGVNDSLASSVTTLTSAIGQNASAISDERIARSTAVDSVAASVTTLAAKVGENTAAITSESIARVNAQDSTAQQLDLMTTEFRAADSSTLSFVQSYSYSKSEVDSAEAAQNTTLKTQWEANDSATLNSAQSYVNTFAYSKSASDASLAAQKTEITSNYKTYADQAKTDAITAAAADVRTYSYSKTTSDSAMASQYNTITANYQAADGAVLTNAQAYVQSYSYSKAAADSAISTQVTQVSARLDNIGGSTLEQKFVSQANTNTGLSSQYTIKIDSNGVAAGIGLASETSLAGVTTSQFMILADKFAVTLPGYPGVVPFTVGAVGGVPRVILSNALIGDATISSAMIGDAQINTLKLAGEAITVPVASYAPSKERRGTGSGNYVVVNEAWINLPEAGMLYMLATAAQTFPGNGGRQWRFKIRLNGVDAQLVQGNLANDCPSVSVSRASTEGVNHVEVLWAGENSGVIFGYCELFVMGVKK